MPELPHHQDVERGTQPPSNFRGYRDAPPGEPDDDGSLGAEDVEYDGKALSCIMAVTEPHGATPIHSADEPIVPPAGPSGQGRGSHCAAGTNLAAQGSDTVEASRHHETTLAPGVFRPAAYGVTIILQCSSGSASASNAHGTSSRPTSAVIIGATVTSPSAIDRNDCANSIGS